MNPMGTMSMPTPMTGGKAGLAQMATAALTGNGFAGGFNPHLTGGGSQVGQMNHNMNQISGNAMSMVNAAGAQEERMSNAMMSHERRTQANQQRMMLESGLLKSTTALVETLSKSIGNIGKGVNNVMSG